MAAVKSLRAKTRFAADAHEASPDGPENAGVLRNGQYYATPEEMTAEWICKKRNNTLVPFDVDKIRYALRRCFLTVGLNAKAFGFYDNDDAIASILRRTLNSLAASADYAPAVETIQRTIITQLWSDGLHEAAEHYQNYREQHRLARLTSAVSPEAAARVTEDQKHFPTDLQYFQFMGKFSRWNDDLGRRETWREAVHDRIMPWMFSIVLPDGSRVRDKLTTAEMSELTEAVYNLEVSPAMRVVQMAGPALDRCNVGAFNCAYMPICDLRSLPELLYILMQGSGVGFSVEDEYVQQLPRIRKQRAGVAKKMIVVGDSTESWCDSYYEAIQLWFDGYDCDFDVSGVRKKNSRLKTKGGRASGPEPFIELMDFTRKVILSRQGKYLKDTHVHRLACFTGRIVQVGGVRRAALISLSELESSGMRTIKSGAWYGHDDFFTNGRYLSMSNNSAVYDFDDGVPVGTFMEEWTSIFKSYSGERGIFNRQAAIHHCPPRRKAHPKFGCNPCAEIILPPYGFCNLSISIARVSDTPSSLHRKVRLATILGKIQSAATKFRYIREEWKKNCEEERLLGVDINGHADCPLLQFDATGREELLDSLKAEVLRVEEEYSTRFGLARSAADTTVKPSGDSAIFFDCGSGLSARFAQHQIRWCREQKGSPVDQFLIDSGVPHADAPEDPNTLRVFGFPREAPVGATLRDDMTAVQQFDNWLVWKQRWSEHSVSATIYVEEHEWPELGAAVFKNMDEITGLAFLPKDNGTYTYAPNVELTKVEYDEFVAKFPVLDWSKLSRYEHEDTTQTAQTFACVGGACDV